MAKQRNVALDHDGHAKSVGGGLVDLPDWVRSGLSRLG
jgi:hypothetical protein